VTSQMTKQMTKFVTPKEAAAILDMSIETVRRHIQQGKLKANKVKGRYQVELPKVTSQMTSQSGQVTSQGDYSTGQSDYINALLERIKSLEAELEARRIEIQQLHAIMGRKALAGPSWWQRLFRRQG
jgi:excisionase family DNA binding protein